jgi:ATP-binding cassette, subfamily F, member 3
MLYLSAQSLSKTYGDKTILDGACVEIRADDRLALVGPNGAGKTTLLRILTGEQGPDGGDLEVSGGIRIGYVKQHAHFPPEATVWSESTAALGDVPALVPASEKIAEQLSIFTEGDEHDRLLVEYEKLQSQILLTDAYNWRHRVERVLQGLGFSPVDYDKSTSKLSGGQQNRLMLACVLLSKPELLILDEPNNHLDVESTEWLEDTLSSWVGAVLVVSHDRYFLDKVANGVLELIDGQIDRFKGNYSAYVSQKELRLEVQRRTFEKQREEIEKLEDFIRRNHAAQKATQAEDRRKKLERIELVQRPREIHTPKFHFPPVTRCGDIVLRVEQLCKAFDKPLLDRVHFQIQRGERWAVVGSNGAGKTTLLRCLLGDVKPDSGAISFGTGVKVGYFDQLVRGLDLELPPMEAVRVPHKDLVDLDRRNLLASFGLAGEVVNKPLKTLSGGERNRTLLAYLSALDPNFLIMDEPTNHLDLWSREALEVAFRAYQGTILMVTHDRYLVNRVADHILVLRGGKSSIIPGNYDDYRHWLSQGMAISDRGSVAMNSTKTANGTSNDKTAANKNAPAQTAKRKRKFPYRKVEQLEADIMTAEEKLQSLQDQMLDPQVLRDGRRVKELQQEIAQSQQTLTQLYEHYEEAVELN